jgi:DNA-binding protein HU-beta
MNKGELVKEIAKKGKVTQRHAENMLNITLDLIQKTVGRGKKVTLVGFGTFGPRKKSARIGRNPQTGETLNIPAKVVPGFSAGKTFKEFVAK